MDNLKNINDVIHWRTKSEIILTQYAMRDRKVGYFVRARYYNNIKIFTEDPTDRDIIEGHWIREKWLKRADDEKQSISITEEGFCALNAGIIETEVSSMLNNYVSVTFSIAAFVISILALLINLKL